MTEEARPLLKETGGGPTVFYKGKFLYSSKDPQAAGRRLAAEARVLPSSLVFIPSFGLGYGVRELLERLPPDCHILCVERDPALMFLAEERALPGFRGEARLTVIQAGDLLPVQQALARLSPGSFRRVVRLDLCGAARLYPEFYREVESYLAREIRVYWQNKMTLIHLGLLYVRNLFANLPLLPRARDLAGLFLDRPLIVVGAGPSLPRTLPLVRELHGRAAVLAVDTALPFLLASGVVPDFVIALEPQFVNIHDFSVSGDWTVPLLADVCSSPQVIRLCLQKGKSPVYFFSSAFHPLALWERLTNAGLLPLAIPPLGSVGVAAVHVALRLTRSPVLLAGLDFSYPFGRAHAPGSPGDRRDLATTDRLHALGQAEFLSLRERPLVSLAGKGGGRVESDLILSSYAQNLNAVIGGERRVFDLNPFGLPLGAPLAATKEAVVAALAGTAAGDGRAREETAGSRPAAWRADTVRDFLESEKTIVGQMIEVLAEAVAPDRPAAGVLDEDRYRLLRRADYAWFHLAGKTTLPKFTKASAAQALLAGRFLLDRIGRAEASLPAD
jgi:hypothetical protein